MFLLSLLMAGAGEAIAAPIDISAQAPASRLERLAWSRLHFKTSILGIPLYAEIKLRILDRQEAQTQLIEPAQSQGIAPGQQVLRLDISSSFISDKDIHTWLLLNSDDASVLQRTRLELTRGDERYKAYRFTDDGIFILRRKPAGAREKNKSFEHWSVSKASFEPYPRHVNQKQIISDTAALLYIGSTMAFGNPGDKEKFAAYFDDKFHVITIEYTGLKSVRADFEARKDGTSSQHIMSYRDASQLIIHAHPAGRPKEESTLQIAGLEPPVELLVDRELGIPLELRGRLGFVGEVSLGLHEATLRQP